MVSTTKSLIPVVSSVSPESLSSQTNDAHYYGVFFANIISGLAWEDY